MRGWIAIGFAAACYQPANLENCTVPCGPNRECPQGYACASNNLCASNGTCSVLPADGGPDGPCMRFGHGLFEPCVPPASIMPQLDVSAGNIATLPDASDPCVTYLQTDMTQVCVLAYQAISIRGGVTLTGTIPVVLIGADSVTVDTTGSIDAASHRGGGIGPGSNPSTCTTENGDSSQSGGGGGAGGTFGALSGGSGGNALDMAAAGGLPALPVGPPYTIRGGCSGGAGGAGTGTPAMTGGAGGGAVMLMSSGPITIAGIVNASGAGAAIALASAGGNGGG
ncbi:MAG TPA: hypothetical protein VMJ10_03760, partial [Kofleriaceae bacterium]|nr:hypothetical protein [Kofleriaceae bacterium]